MKRSTLVIPRELSIRGKRWLVVRSHELLGEDSQHDVRSRLELGSTLDGATYPDGYPTIQREIHLASTLRRRRLSRTFVHELLHACSSQVIPMALEEKFVSDVEAPLEDVLGQLEWRK